MYLARLPNQHDLELSPDAGLASHRATRLLGNVMLSIGSMRFLCKLEITKVDDREPAATDPDPRRVRRHRRRYVLAPAISDQKRVTRSGTLGASRQDRITRPSRQRDALETVSALIVRMSDFAAFINAHPAVLRIVERQSHRPFGGRATRLPQQLNGQNCTVILSDVSEFGARMRTDADRRVIREALLGITHTALQGVPDVWSCDDRGDGLLIVVSPSVPTARIIEHLHRELPAALDMHNRTYRSSARFRLRVAVNVGPVATDAMGVSGEAIIVAARLVDAPLFKQTMRTSEASLGVIVSRFVYETAIRNAQGSAGYSRVQVDVKETSMTAWTKLFETGTSAADL